METIIRIIDLSRYDTVINSDLELLPKQMFRRDAVLCAAGVVEI